MPLAVRRPKSPQATRCVRAASADAPKAQPVGPSPLTSVTAAVPATSEPNTAANAAGWHAALAPGDAALACVEPVAVAELPDRQPCTPSFGLTALRAGEEDHPDGLKGPEAVVSR
jgi:hypothetical protein